MRRPQKIERGKSGKRTVEIERGLVYKHFLNLLNKTYLNSKENIIWSLIKTLFYTHILVHSPSFSPSTTAPSISVKIEFNRLSTLWQTNSSYKGPIWFDSWGPEQPPFLWEKEHSWEYVKSVTIGDQSGVILWRTRAQAGSRECLKGMQLVELWTLPSSHHVRNIIGQIFMFTSYNPRILSGLKPTGTVFFSYARSSTLHPRQWVSDS